MTRTTGARLPEHKLSGQGVAIDALSKRPAPSAATSGTPTAAAILTAKRTTDITGSGNQVIGWEDVDTSDTAIFDTATVTVSNDEIRIQATGIALVWAAVQCSTAKTDWSVSIGPWSNALPSTQQFVNDVSGFSAFGQRASDFRMAFCECSVGDPSQFRVFITAATSGTFVECHLNVLWTPSTAVDAGDFVDIV